MRRLKHDERGYLGPSMVIFMMMLILIAGAAIDLGGQMRAMQQADDVAREAGRQGAQAVDVPQAMSGDRQAVDPGLAQAAAQNYLAASKVSGQVTVQGGTVLDVTTSTSYHPIVLGMIGVGELTAHGHATVQLERVVNGQQR